MYKTVDELFDTVADAIKNHYGTTHPGPKVSTLVVDYDEEYGYPRSVSLDHSRFREPDGRESFITDSQHIYRVKEFALVGESPH